MRRLVTAVLAALLMAGDLAGAQAQDLFANEQKLDEAALGTARGGFSFNGIEIALRVDASVMIDGKPIFPIASDLRVGDASGRQTFTAEGLRVTTMHHGVIGLLIENSVSDRMIGVAMNADVVLGNVDPMSLGNARPALQAINMEAAAFRGF